MWYLSQVGNLQIAGRLRWVRGHHYQIDFIHFAFNFPNSLQYREPQRTWARRTWDPSSLSVINLCLWPLFLIGLSPKRIELCSCSSLFFGHWSVHYHGYWFDRRHCFLYLQNANVYSGKNVVIKSPQIFNLSNYIHPLAKKWNPQVTRSWAI